MIGIFNVRVACMLIGKWFKVYLGTYVDIRPWKRRHGELQSQAGPQH